MDEHYGPLFIGGGHMIRPPRSVDVMEAYFIGRRSMAKEMHYALTPKRRAQVKAILAEDDNAVEMYRDIRFRKLIQPIGCLL